MNDLQQATPVTDHDPLFQINILRVIRDVANRHSLFSSDDVRIIAEREGIVPAHPNSWGAAFTSAVKAKLIVQVGTDRSVIKSRKGGLVRTWRRA